jgi:hypothetical protein
MDNAIAAVFALAVGLFAGGVRMMWCGHRHSKIQRGAGRSGRPDRRRYPRGTDRRQGLR